MDPTAVQIVKRLRDAGFEAYIVGGAARDILLGREPEDTDIATSARPEEVQRLFERTIPIGEKFGVILVLLDDGQYEVATFRNDSEYLDGRRPVEVRFASAREDALRRDFTINALMYDPIEDRWLDFVDGRDDIQQGIIRAIGNPRERFAEDHLRMLRAIRFSFRFEYPIDGESLHAIRDMAPRLARISAERIASEMTKILTGPKAGGAILMMQKLGLLRVILPEVEAMDGVEQPPQFHPEGDVLTHTCLLLNLMESPTPTLAWGGLLHDVGKPPCFTVEDRIRFNGHVETGARMARLICQRLHFPNQLTEGVEYHVTNHHRITTVPEMRPAKRIRFMREEGFEELLELLRLDSLASKGTTQTHDQIRAMYEEEMAKGPSPEPLITGRDLIAVGFESGPRIGEVLDSIQTEQLEGRLNNRDEALRWVNEHYATGD